MYNIPHMSLSKENIFVANWKQSGKRKEAVAWINEIGIEQNLFSGKLIIVCPPLKALDLVAQKIEDDKLPILVGIQDIDVNVYKGEKNTGALSPELLKDSAAYVIIGHSETRRNKRLTDGEIAEKVKVAQSAGLKPIVCVEKFEQAQALKDLLGEYEGVIAYEPPSAIGTGNAASSEEANKIAKMIKGILPSAKVLYGGSVDSNNIKGFIDQEFIDGVLVGNKSLDPSFFKGILRNA
jgi:triosephosphate isomerase (TIM)